MTADAEEPRRRSGPRDRGETLQLEERGERIRFAVKVAPRAARAAVTGVHDGALKVSLTAPPVDGAANRALCELLAKRLRLPRRAVTLVAGERSRCKTLEVEGLDAATLRERLVRGRESGR